ncbi:MAG: DUF481 domain-containing protein [Candidatus Aminicenantes bacterium]|nr:DUF481 domain-containing protein [Candidatus Aminicenantes bacterium]
MFLSRFLHNFNKGELSARLSTEAFLQAEYNEFILLRSRKLGGSGIRYKIYESEGLSLLIGSDIMYEVENFSERDQSEHLTSYNLKLVNFRLKMVYTQSEEKENETKINHDNLLFSNFFNPPPGTGQEKHSTYYN